MKVEKMTWITREDLRANPHKVFLFGDNLERVGLGGQAGAMRGEPNAIGVPTKKTPGMDEGAFFTDAELGENCIAIDDALGQLSWNRDDIVVIPADGLGTGLAELDKRAPKTFAYLDKRLADLPNDPSAGAAFVQITRDNSPPQAFKAAAGGKMADFTICQEHIAFNAALCDDKETLEATLSSFLPGEISALLDAIDRLDDAILRKSFDSK